MNRQQVYNKARYCLLKQGKRAERNGLPTLLSKSRRRCSLGWQFSLETLKKFEVNFPEILTRLKQHENDFSQLSNTA